MLSSRNLEALARPLRRSSRQHKREIIHQIIAASGTKPVLEIGVSGASDVEADYVSRDRRNPQHVVACAHTWAQAQRFAAANPQTQTLVGDGCDLPFASDSFSVAVSNAVLEHVGTRERQRQFIAEMLRVAPQVCLATPNRWFPVDLHTYLPLLHFLPMAIRNRMYRRLGHAYWACEEHLNLLSARQLRALIPPSSTTRLVRLRLLGLTHSLLLLVQR